MRKVIQLLLRLCSTQGLSDWRQNEYHLRRLKKLFRRAQKSNRSKAKGAEEKKKDAYANYLNQASALIQKALSTVDKLTSLDACTRALVDIRDYLDHANRQVSQTDRRVLQDEVIPTAEKVYSLFQPHTEWISKGKAGVPVELGVKVCIMECQYGFILHHRVMENEQDVDVAVDMVKDTKAKFPPLSLASFDKGFHSPSNQASLTDELATVVLPQKGRLSKKEKARESEETFGKARKQHSAVESGINALEVHGLDRCPDHGIDGFKRYVSLGILARNIQQVGAICRQKEQGKERRRRKRMLLKQAA